jgi:DNA-binding NtrC family response regulator
MTTVLVVNHDIDIADEQASSLRRSGYQVTQCSGPSAWTCPVLRGEACSWVATADVLLYDVWATGEPDGARELIEGLRELHPTIPIVLAAPGMELSWVETSGRHRITPLVGKVNGPSLATAIEAALASARAPVAVAT